MTPDETAAVKQAVKEAVKEQLPETLAEQLSPMITRTVRGVNRPFRRMVLGGLVLVAIGGGLLFKGIGDQADENTSSNNRQDCYLAGLIRSSLGDNSQRLTSDQRRRGLAIIKDLEEGRNCPAPKQPTLRKGNP